MKFTIKLGGTYDIRTDVDDPILDLTDQSFRFGSSKFLNISNFALPSSFTIELRLSISNQMITSFKLFSLIQKAEAQLVIEYNANGNLKIQLGQEQLSVKLDMTATILVLQLFIIKIYDDMNGPKMYGKFYQLDDQGEMLIQTEFLFSLIDLSQKYIQHLLVGSPSNSIDSEFVKFYEVKVSQGAFFMENSQIQNCKLTIDKRCTVCQTSYYLNQDGTCQTNCPPNFIFNSYHNKCIKKCHNLCESCLDSDPSQCIVCAGDRINPPNCECQQGFEDYVSPICKKYLKDTSVQVGIIEIELTTQQCCWNGTYQYPLTEWELSQRSTTTAFILANTMQLSYHNDNIVFRQVRYQIFEYSNYQIFEQTAEINYNGDSKYQYYFGTSTISTTFDIDFPLSIDYTVFMKNYLVKYLTISQTNEDGKLRIRRFFQGRPSNNWTEYFTVFVLATLCKQGVCNYYQSMINQCHKEQVNCDSYYFDGSSMVQCNTNCYECASPGNICLSCSTFEFRELDASTSTCKCIDGYFGGLSGYCDKCNTGCKTCETSSTQCTSCINHQFVDSQNNCQECNSNCKTCEISSEHCLSCYDHYYLGDNSICICNPGYYYSLENIRMNVNICKPCDSNCQECDNSSTHCTSCMSGQYIDYLYFCQNCDSNCQTCEFHQDNCTSCRVNAVLNSIQNTAGMLIDQCVCNSGYYMTLDYECQICDENCHQCIDRATKCTSCVDKLYLDSDYICQNCDQTKCFTCELEPTRCLSCNSTFYLLENECVPCHKSCESCSGPLNTECITCITDMTKTVEQLCVCKMGYFEIEPLGCSQCQETCKMCDKQSECQECIEGLNRVLDESNQCSCQVGYYQFDNILECQKCSDSCVACTNRLTCTSCDSKQHRILVNGQYECEVNFFPEELSNNCVTCNSKAGMIQDICNYQDCSDKVWTKGEECDDGNNIPRDGCTSCKVDPDYQCINEVLQSSICKQCQQNCKVCGYQKSVLECSQCYEGYYLQENQCYECKENCKICSSLKLCTSCMVHPLLPKENGKCPYCEDTEGLITVGNQCQSICGDGIIYQPTEECDDGNMISDDGCDRNCMKEKNFICEEKSCTRIYPPVPIIIAIEPERQTKGISLYTTIHCWLKEQIQLNRYQLKSVVFFSEDILVNINLKLSNSFESNYLSIHFNSPKLIVGLNGLSQEIDVLEIQITDYYFVSETAKQISDHICFLNNLILYIFCGLIILALLFGGLEAFWNLFDILQIFSYFKFIQTTFPFNVSSLLEAFEFGNLSFLDNLLYIKDLINLSIDSEELQQYSPQGILADQVETGLFIINIQSTISAYVIVFILYLLSTFVLFILPQIIQLLLKSFWKSNLLKTTIFCLYKSIFRYFSKYKRNFFWNILIRIHMSTAYDLSAAIAIQFLFNYSDMLSPLAKVSYITCCMLCILQVASVLFYTAKIGITKAEFIKSRFQDQYGESLFDSLNTQKIGSTKTYYNVFLFMKRHLHMLLLISLISVPQFQTVGIGIVGLMHIMFLVFFNPLENKIEHFKQVSSEILMYFINMKIFLLTLDDQLPFLSLVGRVIIGWVLVGEITTILLSQFIIDLYLQGTILKRFCKIQS